MAQQRHTYSISSLRLLCILMFVCVQLDIANYLVGDTFPIGTEWIADSENKQETNLTDEIYYRSSARAAVGCLFSVFPLPLPALSARHPLYTRLIPTIPQPDSRPPHVVYCVFLI